MKIAAIGESISNHPIAKSILAAYKEKSDGAVIDASSESAKEIAGHGISATYEGKELLLGNAGLLEEKNISFMAPNEYGTVVYASLDGKFIGSIVISDVIKPEAKEAIASMKKVGVKKAVMLTGDRKYTADYVAAQVGIDEIHPELLPADKVDMVEKMLDEADNKSNLAFVGDGINDAPVLMRADVGIAMGSLGSDAAIEAADIVIMDDDIRKISSVIKIARKTITIVKENIVFALGVKILILILGALGIASMWLAVFGDVGVAVLAILNSMRAMKIDK